jgi:hypothetical protein
MFYFDFSWSFVGLLYLPPEELKLDSKFEYYDFNSCDD